MTARATTATIDVEQHRVKRTPVRIFVTTGTSGHSTKLLRHATKASPEVIRRRRALMAGLTLRLSVRSLQLEAGPALVIKGSREFVEGCGRVAARAGSELLQPRIAS